MAAVFSVTIPFAVYLLTLAPSVTFFDSGEFITAIHSLGSAHSPGYPLFINYAKPFTYLPLGDIAFRVNIATAFSAAMASYGVYLLILNLLEGEGLSGDPILDGFYRRTTALGSALVFAFSARLWLQSNHDKPYPLVAFLSALIFYFLLQWRKKCRFGSDSPSYIYLSSYIFGLSFAAHQTIVLLFPTYLYLVISMKNGFLRRLKEMFLSLSFALIGFSIHLHLPIRATRNPLLNWGDPQTLHQFLWHFLRHGYPVDKPPRSLSLVSAQLSSFNIPHEFTWVGLAFLLTGLSAYIHGKRDEVIAYLIGVFVFLATIIGYLNTPTDMIFLTKEFFTPLYLLTAVFIGLGAFFMLKTALSGMAGEKLRTVSVRGVALIAIFALPFTLCATNYRQNDQHENHIAFDYAANTLLPLPEQAILYTWGDSGAFPLWYLQGVERMREDLSIVHAPHLYFSWYLDTFPALFREGAIRETPLKGKAPEFLLELAISGQIGKRPVYVDFSTKYSTHLDSYAFHQEGICYRLEREQKDTSPIPDLAVWDLYSLRGTDGGLFKMDLDTAKAILIYAYSRMESGETLIRLGHKMEGAEQLLIAERMAPALKPQIDEMLGMRKLDKKSDR